MVLEHVPEHPGLLVVTGSFAQVYRFRNGDLDVVDVVPVPDGLENGVGKPQHQQVLDGFFSEIMVDTEDLVFGENRMNGLVKSLSRCQVRTEGFFDYHPPPSARCISKASGAKV